MCCFYSTSQGMKFSWLVIWLGGKGIDYYQNQYITCLAAEGILLFDSLSNASIRSYVKASLYLLLRIL